MRQVGLRAMVQKRPVRVERKLSAILAADVAGYSRLMHNDEEATHSKVTALLTDAVAPAIAEHGGRIVYAGHKGCGPTISRSAPAIGLASNRAIPLTKSKTLRMARAELPAPRRLPKPLARLVSSPYAGPRVISSRKRPGSCPILVSV